MTWRQYLQSRTRNPAFLWRMVIVILLTGVVVGLVVDWAMPEWITVEAGDVQFVEPESPPEPEPTIPHWERLDRLAAQRNWLALWGAIPRALVDRWLQIGAAALAVLTGLCWLAFSMQAIQPRSRSDWRTWMPPLAAALGVLSIWPTFFLIYWQKYVWGLEHSSELQPGLRDNVLGVGLREELSKLVCFLPLLPPLVRRRDELAALVVAGCVGIGFGMMENINYIAGSVGSGTLGRLLTALPAHMTLTGLLGLAAYRACVWPRECGPQFVAMFVVIVMAHGVYDALLSITVLQEYAFFSMLIFVGLVYQFFRELRPKQKLRVEPISLTANFLFCVSTVAAATFVYLSAAAGWKMAGDVLVAGIVGQGVMVYMFLREMPETMVTV
jgi:RsiW-degrading membrane proteinase PrsW (M82 family)